MFIALNWSALISVMRSERVGYSILVLCRGGERGGGIYVRDQ
jgi:hypothetical protein